MAADTTSERPAPERVVVEVQDSREIGPAEAEGLLRECLSLTHKRLDAAIWRTLERLQGAAAEDDEDPAAAPLPSPVVPTASKLDDTIAAAVHAKRALFAPRVRAEFDQAFQRRREGEPRARGQREQSSVALAIVDYGDQSAQVALRSAAQAMREATLEEAFALDFRVRMVLREPPLPAGTFDNPWSAEYMCDAFGNACRELWPEDGLWRPIMERLVRGTTSRVAALHRELNVLLQDRDVLPALRVRTHSRGGAPMLPNPGGRALFDRLVEMLDTGSQTHAAAMAGGAGMVPAGGATLPMPDSMGGNPASIWPATGGTTRTGRGWTTGAADWAAQQSALLWPALVAALGNLQRGQALVPGLPELAGIDREALQSGTANQLPALKAAFGGKGGAPAARATIDVVAGVLDYVFDDPYLPAEIKTAFGRLQIPMLRAALLDQRVISDPQHPARRFFDTLAQASVDLQPETERGHALVELASRLAEEVRDGFGDDFGIFETAKIELDAFLDTERADVNERLAEAVPPLIAQDQRADARAEAQAALEARLAGRAVPPEIRAFLDHECVERLATTCLKDGPEGAAWETELAMLDDLLWSITPKTNAAARQKLASLLPPLLRSIDRDWSAEDDAQARRQALLSCLFDLHLSSMKAASEPATAAIQATPAAMANATRMPPLPEPDEHDEQVMALVRGDWVEFKGESDGTSVLARLAWRAPQRRRILFTHRDGRTAFVHTPESLADAFRSGRAIVAIEAVPLFDRAMARLVAQRSGQTGSVAAPAA
jgi:uncharacterized protein DUF1631